MTIKQRKVKQAARRNFEHGIRQKRIEKSKKRNRVVPAENPLALIFRSTLYV